MQTAMSALNAGAVPDNTNTTTYIVHQGDTVWSITAQLDTRDNMQAAVDWVVTKNGLKDCVIQPGQALIVPVSGR